MAKALAVQERQAMRLRSRDASRGPKDDLDYENEALLAASAAAAAAAAAACDAPAGDEAHPMETDAAEAHGAAPATSAALQAGDSDAETDSDGGCAARGPTGPRVPQTLPGGAAELEPRASATCAATGAWVPLGERPAFPPETLNLRPAFPGDAALGEDAAGELLGACAFLGSFAGLLGVWPATLGELGGALAAGQASRLCGEAHVALLRLLVADMEDAHAGGALQVGLLVPTPIPDLRACPQWWGKSYHAAAPAAYCWANAHANGVPCELRRCAICTRPASCSELSGRATNRQFQRPAPGFIDHLPL